MSQFARRFSRFGAVLGLLLGLISPPTSWAQQGPLPKTQLKLGIYLISAEVAQTPQQQEIGLMLRTSLKDNDGMLFIWPQKQRVCMWMKNTLIPLSVAFLDEDGSILNIEDMQPQTTNEHCASKPSRYALEMPLDWFKKRGFKAGAKLQGGPFQ